MPYFDKLSTSTSTSSAQVLPQAISTSTSTSSAQVLRQAAQVFKSARVSLKITDLKFDINLYFNALLIRVSGLISNSAAVSSLVRRQLVFID
jgi:hypothetical protein